jgi:hypothetical protein
MLGDLASVKRMKRKPTHDWGFKPQQQQEVSGLEVKCKHCKRAIFQGPVRAYGTTSVDVWIHTKSNLMLCQDQGTLSITFAVPAAPWRGKAP